MPVSTTATVTVANRRARASTVPGTWDDQAYSVEVMWSSGAAAPAWDYQRGSFVETLDVSEKACDLTRLKAGASVLNDHRIFGGVRGILGVVEDAWVKGGKAYARVRFSRREEIADIVQDVKDGVMHQFSVGYDVFKYEDVSEVGSDVKRHKAILWQPFELSLTVAGAEVGAGTRSAAPSDAQYQVEISTPSSMSGQAFGSGVKASTSNATPAAPSTGDAPFSSQNRSATAVASQEGDSTSDADEGDGSQADGAPEATVNRSAGGGATSPVPIPTPAPAVDTETVRRDATLRERSRVEEITTHCRGIQLPDEVITRLVNTGETLDDLQPSVDAAYRQMHQGNQFEISPHGRAQVGEEDITKARNTAIGCLAARMIPGTAMPEDAGEYRARSLMDTVRLMEGVRGNDGLKMPKAAVQKRAFHTTGDLPILLEEAGRRTLEAMYALYQATYGAWTRSGTLTDFRPHDRVRVGDAPEMEETPDGADVKFGTIGESKETIKLLSYSKGIALGRQALINDDLGGFARLIQAQAQRVSDLVSNLVYEQLRSGKVGGKALHHASHNNTLQGVLDVDNLGVAEAAMLLQKSAGGMPLALMPKFLLVPAALKATADKITTAITPAQATQVNPFAGRLTTIVEPRLDASDNKQWHLVADPAQIDTIEIAWLEGNEGPQYDSAEVFENRGIKYSVWADVAAKAMDFRGFQKSDGVNP